MIIINMITSSIEEIPEVTSNGYSEIERLKC